LWQSSGWETKEAKTSPPHGGYGLPDLRVFSAKIYVSKMSPQKPSFVQFAKRSPLFLRQECGFFKFLWRSTDSMHLVNKKG
jgi:hypothetical protein